MTTATYAVLVYGLIVIAGGLIGYLKAGSTPSLIMGNIFGIALLICGLGSLKSYQWSYYGALTLTAILTLFFAVRFILSKAWMPGGLMMVASLLALLIMIFSGWKR